MTPVYTMVSPVDPECLKRTASSSDLPSKPVAPDYWAEFNSLAFACSVVPSPRRFIFYIRTAVQLCVFICGSGYELCYPRGDFQSLYEDILGTVRPNCPSRLFCGASHRNRSSAEY